MKRGLQIGSCNLQLTNLSMKEVSVQAHWVRYGMEDEKTKYALEQSGRRVKGEIKMCR